MSIEDVIQNYQFLLITFMLNFVGTTSLVVLFTFLFSYLGRKLNTKFVLICALPLGLSLGIFMGIYFGYNRFNLDEWKNNDLKSYLEQQDEKKIMIDEFVIIPDSKKKAIYARNLKESELVSVKFTFTEDSMPNEVTLTSIMKKEAIKQPYLTYKQVEKTISDDFSINDYYEAVLHVPNDSGTNLKQINKGK